MGEFNFDRACMAFISAILHCTLLVFPFMLAKYHAKENEPWGWPKRPGKWFDYIAAVFLSWVIGCVAASLASGKNIAPVDITLGYMAAVLLSSSVGLMMGYKIKLLSR